ncbi:MAG: lysophospholipid acyltransferase family protein [Acidobacteria bacterium]|nr:lysophospholipid acyltransferase family protein [Acidobacteriota bacterium]MCK6682295.1 lysophospholipid acyltransferase family protein [Thermoanaerobaculia bacterium]
MSSATCLKAPPPPSPVSRLTQKTFGLWFPFFRHVVRHVPPEWLCRLSTATVEKLMWRRESLREAILDNVACVLGRPASDFSVEEAAREMLANHSRSWIDFLRNSARPGVDCTELVAEQIGTEHLRNAHREGRGAILLTAHAGNFELGGLFLRDLGLEANVVYAPDPSPVVEKYRTEARQAMGVKGIPITTSPLSFVAILRALEANEFVAIQGDRDISGTGRPVPFFGKMVSFPVGPFRLAAAGMAPLLPVFVLMTGDGRYQTVVKEPIRLATGARRSELDSVLDSGMRAFARVLEDVIRAHPAQWYRFTRFWEK